MHGTDMPKRFVEWSRQIPPLEDGEPGRRRWSKQSTGWAIFEPLLRRAMR